MRTKHLLVSSAILLALFAASQLMAHNTLFGVAPRTMFKGGWEVELDSHWDISKDYMEDDKDADNPNDRRLYRVEFGFAAMYGVTKDFSVRAHLPFAYKVETSNDRERRTKSGVADAELAIAYRLDPLIWGKPYTFKGGSFQILTWTTLRAPTGEDEGLPGKQGRELDLGKDGGFGFRTGISSALSTLRYYLWTEFSFDYSFEEDGAQQGVGYKFHVANAWRLRPLKDYRENDYLVLIEGDVEYREKGKLNSVTNPNSGYLKTHLGVGFQINITNKYEVKVGYNLPLYRSFNGRQFVHEGELGVSFGMLF